MIFNGLTGYGPGKLAKKKLTALGGNTHPSIHVT
jgi:hypothetical protein